MKTATMLLTLIFSVIVHAQTAPDISSKDEAERSDRAHIKVYGGLANFNYDLGGSGVTVDATDTNNVVYGVEMKYNSMNFSWQLGYDRSEATFEGPSGNTPTTVDVVDGRTYALVGNKLFRDSGIKALADLTFNVGYYLSSRSSDRSTPVELMVDSDRSGFILGTEMTKSINADFNSQFAATLYMVNSIKEKPSKTGYFESGYELAFKYSVMYSISRRVDISTGAFLNYSKINFDGTGGRSVTNAAETEMKYGIPFDVWIFF